MQQNNKYQSNFSSLVHCSVHEKKMKHSILVRVSRRFNSNFRRFRWKVVHDTQMWRITMLVHRFAVERKNFEMEKTRHRNIVDMTTNNSGGNADNFKIRAVGDRRCRRGCARFRDSIREDLLRKSVEVNDERVVIVSVVAHCWHIDTNDDLKQKPTSTWIDKKQRAREKSPISQLFIVSCEFDKRQFPAAIETIFHAKVVVGFFRRNDAAREFNTRLLSRSMHRSVGSRESPAAISQQKKTPTDEWAHALLEQNRE